MTRNLNEVAISGILTHGLLAVQDRGIDKKRIVRRGLQGGVAIVASNSAYSHFVQGRSFQALATVAAGALGVWLLENLLKEGENNESAEL